MTSLRSSSDLVNDLNDAFSKIRRQRVQLNRALAALNWIVSEVESEYTPVKAAQDAINDIEYLNDK